MTRTNSMLIRWRVQYRHARGSKWKNAGLFETREAARTDAACRRVGWEPYDREFPIGFGNTRVLRHVGKGKRSIVNGDAN